MDRRTKRQKLEAMANQNTSPEEAKIAQEKLKSLPPDPEPRITLVFRGLDGRTTIFTLS